MLWNYHSFRDSIITQHPEFKVGKSTFQLLRPKNIKLVCCCMYHQNLDCLRKTITRVLKFNKETSDLFTSNESLCSSVLWDDNNMLCINQKYGDCKDFTKLMQYNAEYFSGLKCSDSCFQNGVDCNDDKVKCLQYGLHMTTKAIQKKKSARWQILYFTRINRINKNTFERFP